MICIIRLTFWSLPMIWSAIGVLAIALAYLYCRIFGMRRMLYTPKEVAELLRMQEEALASNEEQPKDSSHD